MSRLSFAVKVMAFVYFKAWWFTGGLTRVVQQPYTKARDCKGFVWGRKFLRSVEQFIKALSSQVLTKCQQSVLSFSAQIVAICWKALLEIKRRYWCAIAVELRIKVCSLCYGVRCKANNCFFRRYCLYENYDRVQAFVVPFIVETAKVLDPNYPARRSTDGC